MILQGRKGSQRRKNENECQGERVKEGKTAQLTANEGAQPGVSMAWVRVMEGLQGRKRRKGEGGRRERARAKLAIVSLKRVCVHATLVQRKLTFKG